MADQERTTEGCEGSIRFLLNDDLIAVDEIEPTVSVLHYLREQGD